jgi:hypothetical protein
MEDFTVRNVYVEHNISCAMQVIPQHSLQFGRASRVILQQVDLSPRLYVYVAARCKA